MKRAAYHFALFLALALTSLGIYQLLGQAQEPRIIVSDADTVRSLDANAVPPVLALDSRVVLLGANTQRVVDLGLLSGFPSGMSQDRVILHGANTNRVIELVPPFDPTQMPIPTDTPSPTPTATDTPTPTSPPPTSTSPTPTPTSTTTLTVADSSALTETAAPASATPTATVASTAQPEPTPSRVGDWLVAIATVIAAIIGAIAVLAAAFIGLRAKSKKQD